jgi:hypothetical protein
VKLPVKCLSSVVGRWSLDVGGECWAAGPITFVGPCWYGFDRISSDFGGGWVKLLSLGVGRWWWVVDGGWLVLERSLASVFLRGIAADFDLMVGGARWSRQLNCWLTRN